MRLRATPAVLIAALVLCFAALAGAAARTTVIHIGGMNCPGCAKNIEGALGKIAGVKKIEASFEKSRAVVTHDDTVSDRTLVNAVLESGYQAGLVEGQLEEPDLLKAFDKERDVKVISAMGEDVDITAHLVPGKVTVIDFSATWCAPCRKVDETLAGLLASGGALAVRKVNVVEWSSAVARRYLAERASLPYLRVYGPDGKLAAEIGDGKVKKLAEIVQAQLDRVASR